MSDIVIQAENISKMYQLGSIGSGSLRRDMQYWWEREILKKENPNQYINGSKKIDNADMIWALKNINFELKQGEALGIIGSNGAGKSTLLKVLSRIVKPTEGIVRGRGRISSLLEVGTGFHAELTGRENIFISGHILGMKKTEILAKFDEIVDFSGVEAFIDTPVKRYSSGMYVRLAFAVAAHLEPDILIVDEVLAVGDADFQKKCLGKMNDASNKSGRTIIFVSHNLQAVNNLCTNALWLEKGSVRSIGNTKSVVNEYLSTLHKKSSIKEFSTLNEAPGNDFIRVMYIELIPDLLDPNEVLDIRTPLTVKFRFYNASDDIVISTDLLLFTLAGECIFDIPSKPAKYKKGFIEGECKIPGNFLNDGSYTFTLHFAKDTSSELFSYEECLMFDIADYRENSNWYDKWWGYVRPDFPLLLTPTGNNLKSL
ncbi:ABC transporter ATP-binding protein [Flavobacterium sp. Arc2]|uniref:ABC transporter ATP-binding protein n=1 Tax=Flavobacterium sp. Arc2 TaxID=3046685 RepID=UPI00352C4B1B